MIDSLAALQPPDEDDPRRPPPRQRSARGALQRPLDGIGRDEDALGRYAGGGVLRRTAGAVGDDGVEPAEEPPAKPSCQQAPRRRSQSPAHDPPAAPLHPGDGAWAGKVARVCLEHQDVGVAAGQPALQPALVAEAGTAPEQVDVLRVAPARPREVARGLDRLRGARRTGEEVETSIAALGQAVEERRSILRQDTLLDRRPT